MAQIPGDIKAVCRICKRPYPSSSFTLDPIYKVMACPNCIKERRSREDVKAEFEEQKNLRRQEELNKHEQQKSKPAGWDIEDEYLERRQKQVMPEKAHTVALDRDRVKYQCQKCKYTFVYNIPKGTPSVCPYCAKSIKI